MPSLTEGKQREVHIGPITEGKAACWRKARAFRGYSRESFEAVTELGLEATRSLTNGK